MIIKNEKGRAAMNIAVKGQIVEQATSFSYHGHIITDEGRSNRNPKEKNGEKYIEQN